jgi:hypothetical protein
MKMRRQDRTVEHFWIAFVLAMLLWLVVVAIAGGGP